MKLPEAHKSLLARLVTSLFPLVAWVSDRKASGCGSISASSWTESSSAPAPFDLDVAVFIESLLEDDPGDAVSRRKRARAQSARVRYAGPVADAGSNSIRAEEVWFESGPRWPLMTRGQLYERSLSALSQLVESQGRSLGDMPGAAWDAFLKDITRPATPPRWPEGTPAPVEFLRQLNKDCREAAWKLDRPSPTGGQATAVEAGEDRGRGNRYTPEEVRIAVTKLERLLKLKPW